MKTTRILAVAAGFALVAAAAFLWGYVAHRNEIFPYPQARQAAVAIGLISPQPQAKFEIFSRPFADVHALDALGYVEGTPDDRPDIAGVIELDPDRAFPGPRIFSSVHTQEARLISVEGELLHRWTHDSVEDWHYSRLLPGGDLIVMDRENGLLRLSRDSDLEWSTPVRAHHDFDIWRDTIFVLTRENCVRGDVNPVTPIVCDAVSTFTLDGEPLDRLSLLDTILSSDYAYLVPSLDELRFAPDADERDRPLCLLHANHVEVVGPQETWPPRQSDEPRLLVTLRNINSVAAMDLAGDDISWLWGPNTLVYPHHASVLPDGNLTVFSNGLEQSEVLELDPATFDVVWRYTEPDFFSATRGSVQRLPNGNTLVTESNEGRAFELAPDGDIVWDWRNPAFTDDGKRRAVFRMTALESTPEWLQ